MVQGGLFPTAVNHLMEQRLREELRSWSHGKTLPWIKPDGAYLRAVPYTGTVSLTDAALQSSLALELWDCLFEKPWIWPLMWGWNRGAAHLEGRVPLGKGYLGDSGLPGAGWPSCAGRPPVLCSSSHDQEGGTPGGFWPFVRLAIS